MKEILLVGGRLSGTITRVDDDVKDYYIHSKIPKNVKFYHPYVHFPEIEYHSYTTKYSFWENSICIAGTEIHLKAFVHEDLKGRNITQIVLGLVLSTLITEGMK